MGDSFTWADTTDPILDVPVPDGATLNDVPDHLYKIVAAVAAATGVSRLTAAQRDALKPANKPVGRMIHNLTAKRFEWWDGATWADVAGDVSAYVRRAGATMTGPLLLAGDPTEDMSAVPKAWVDARAGSGFLPLSGGTMRGAISLAGAPTDNLHAASKAYTDQVARKALPRPATFTAGPHQALWSRDGAHTHLRPGAIDSGDIPVSLYFGDLKFSAAGVYRIDMQITTEATNANSNVWHRAQIGNVNGHAITFVDRCSLAAFGAYRPITQWVSAVLSVHPGDLYRIGVYLTSVLNEGYGTGSVDWARISYVATLPTEEG